MKKLFFVSLIIFTLLFAGNVFGDDIVKIGFQDDIKTLNYFKASDVWSANVLDMIYESLYVYAPETYNFTPWIADGQPIIEDENTIVIKLRKNVSWSDGTKFTADDVVFSAHVYIDYAIPRYLSSWEFIEKVEKRDDYTVVYKLKEMRATFIHGTLRQYIYPKHIWGELIDKATSGAAGSEAQSNILNIDPTEAQTVGTGPFVLKEWNKNQYVSMVANDKYHMNKKRIKGKSKTYRIGPFVDGLLYRIYRSTDVAVEAIKQGDIDFIWWAIPVGHILKLANDKNIYMTSNPENGFKYLAFNVRKSPFKYKEFRQAMAWLIDRNFIETRVLKGYGQGMLSVVAPGNKAFYNQNLTDYGTNSNLSREERVEKAKSLLKSAGFSWDSNGLLVDPDGQQLKPFEILTPPADYDPLRAQCGIFVSAWWNEIGIPSTPKPTSFGEIVDRTFTNRDFDVFILGWRLDVFPDHMRDFFHTSQDIPDGNNPMGFRNPEFDKIADDFVKELDPAKQVEKAKKLQEILADECVYIPLYTVAQIEAHSKKFYGWVNQLDGTGNIWSFRFLRPVK